MVQLQRIKLREKLGNLTKYEMYKNRKIIEIKKGSDWLVYITLHEEPKKFKGIWDPKTNEFKKKEGNIQIRQMLSILESELVFEGEGRANYEAQQVKQLWQFWPDPIIK